MKKRYFIAFIITILLLCITHHIWLGYKESMNFDCLLFIIILVLGYLLSLKLTSYIADFKTLQNQSRIEIIFLSVFFVLLFLPISNIDQGKIVKSENRTLAKWKPLITQKGTLNFKFGKDFEDWFNDRFFLRSDLINLNYIYKLLLNNEIKTNQITYTGSNNWAIFNPFLPNKNIISDDNYPIILKNLNKFNEFCAQNNIKLYVLIVPPSEYLYQEQQIKEAQKPEDLKFINDKINILKQQANTKIIYPYEALKKASKKDWVAYKVDIHWTEYGAFIGYNELIKAIQKDFNDITPVKESDYITFRSKKIRSDFNRKFEDGWCLKAAPFLNIFAHKILDTEYLNYDNKKINLLKTKVVDIEGARNKTFYYPKGANYRVLEMGTSMNENLLQFTPYTFKNLKYIRLNTIKGRPNKEEFKIMKYYKKDILNYKPDIIIFCITPINLTRIPQIFEKK